MQEDTEGVINFSLIKCVLKINCLQNVFKKNEITYFSAKKNTVRNILRYGSNKMRKFFLIIPLAEHSIFNYALFFAAEDAK